MASYKLKKDFKKSFFSSTNGKQDELYWKIGSVINGKPNGSIVTTDGNGEVPKEGIIGIPSFEIPVDYLETISETKTKLILGNDSVNLNTPKNDKTFFTTKNVVIGVVGIVAILGILKWKKII